MDLYRDPKIYDLVYQGGTADQFASLLRIANGAGVPSRGPWLEPACGSGRLLAAAEGGGIAVAGFDREPRMVDFARSRLSADADLRVADLESFAEGSSPRSFPFAFTLVNTIRHLESDAQVLRHFADIAEILTERGVYVVGVSLFAGEGSEIEEDVWRGEAEGIAVTEAIQSIPPEAGSRIETMVSHLTIERRGAAPEHRDSVFTLRTYEQSQWEKLIAASPLEISGIFNVWGDPMPAFDGAYFLYALRPKRGSTYFPR